MVITGAHSGIGQQLIERLIGEHVSVLGLVTPWCKAPGLLTHGDLVEYVPCDLREPLDDQITQQALDAQILVHLAWARPKNTRDATRDNITIYDNVRAALPDGIKTVYMSSVCATADNPSNYGQAKYHLSQRIGAENMVEIIAGLVMSEPAIGPYLALQNFVCGLHAAFKFLPSPPALLAKPGQVIDALVNAVLDYDNCPRIMAAYDPEAVRLNDLIANILKEKNVAAIPVPVPTGVTVAMLYLVRKLIPGLAISDRLITLFTVSPVSLAKRMKAETGEAP